MLLLVLILVLAAFGLLLVALVTGMAAWAWISVVVSVAAAGVLVYDWAQRRAAVKNGDGPASEMIDPPTTMIPAREAMADPATEVFPAVRMPSSASDPQGSQPDRATDLPLGATPSGSAEQPPSAEPKDPRTSDGRSRSVTSDGSEPSMGRDSDEAARWGDGRVDSGAGDPVKAGDQPSSSPQWPDESRTDRPGVPLRDQPANRSSHPPEVAAAAGTPANADQLQGDADAAGAPERTKSDAEIRSVGTPVTERTPGSGAGAGDTPTAHAPVEDEPADAVPVGPTGDEPTGARDTDADTADAAVAPIGMSADDEQQTAGGPEQPVAKSERGPERTTMLPPTSRRDQPATQASMEGPEATQAIVPVRPPTPEPAQEQAEPAAAAIVATLADEVLVVDEQPRYHLTGCRILVGLETIPLSAREAVSYEFTPCAVCKPVRVLAARNRAASSS